MQSRNVAAQFLSKQKQLNIGSGESLCCIGTQYYACWDDFHHSGDVYLRQKWPIIFRAFLDCPFTIVIYYKETNNLLALDQWISLWWISTRAYEMNLESGVREDWNVSSDIKPNTFYVIMKYGWGKTMTNILASRLLHAPSRPNPLICLSVHLPNPLHPSAQTIE